MISILEYKTTIDSSIKTKIETYVEFYREMLSEFTLTDLPTPDIKIIDTISNIRGMMSFKFCWKGKPDIPKKLYKKKDIYGEIVWGTLKGRGFNKEFVPLPPEQEKALRRFQNGEGLEDESSFTLELQKTICFDDNTLERVIAHEMCHLAEFDEYDKLKRKAEKGDLAAKKGCFILKSDNDSSKGHGKRFFYFADFINRVKGSNFVTKTSDESYETKSTKNVYYFVIKQNETLYWNYFTRVTPNTILAIISLLRTGRDAWIVKGDETLIPVPNKGLSTRRVYSFGKDKTKYQEMEKLLQGEKINIIGLLDKVDKENEMLLDNSLLRNEYKEAVEKELSKL